MKCKRCNDTKEVITGGNSEFPLYGTCTECTTMKREFTDEERSAVYDEMSGDWDNTAEAVTLVLQARAERDELREQGKRDAYVIEDLNHQLEAIGELDNIKYYLNQALTDADNQRARADKLALQAAGYWAAVIELAEGLEDESV